MALAPECRERRRGAGASCRAPISHLSGRRVPPRRLPLELLAWSSLLPSGSRSLHPRGPFPHPVAPGGTECGCVLSAGLYSSGSPAPRPLSWCGCAMSPDVGQRGDRSPLARPEVEHGHSSGTGAPRLEFSGFCVPHMSHGSLASWVLGSWA